MDRNGRLFLLGVILVLLAATLMVVAEHRLDAGLKRVAIGVFMIGLVIGIGPLLVFAVLGGAS